ncbi:sulfite exporter TauE/SafE family protein [Cytophagaceae bacterium ABcell3]|nr:sulfite exporter TauE/SafE family protein [Cytophagaceae bacterium ABcell3]
MLNIFLLVIGSFIVFVLSTISGGGASLLLMPLIALTVGVKSVAPIMTLGIAMSSSSKVYFFWQNIDWNLFKWLFPSTIIGSVLGAMMFAYLSSEYLQIIIGVFLVSTIFQLRKKEGPTKSRIKTWHFVPMGFGISFLSGLIGGVGPLMNSAYLSYGMSKESMIGTRAANAVVLHITKIISYAWLGYVTQEVLLFGLLIGASATFATYTGKVILKKISDLFFKKVVVITMVVSGAIMLWRHKEAINGFTEYVLSVCQIQ